MKQHLFCVPILLLLTVALFFSTIIFLSQQTQADIQGQTGSYNRPGGFLPTGLPLSKLQANSTDQGLKERLTGSALAYLKAEHEVKLTGKRPTRPLVTRYDGEQNRERTEEEQISAGLRLNQHYKESVRRLTDVEVALTPSALRVEKDKTLLQATEHTIYRYSVRPGVDLPDTSEDQVVHVFVFRNELANPVGKQNSEPTLIRADYKSRNAKMTRATARLSQIYTECDPYGNCMVYDSTGCDPYGYYPCEDSSFENSNYCCYAEEVQYLQPSGDQPIAPNSPTSNNPNACNYNGNDAGWYADIYAFSYNTSYRHFDNDCTNFVSQALAERGRFCYRGFKLKNWYHWWYNSSGSQNKGQSRTWTQAVALRFFVKNTGRGYNTGNICDLSEGDLIFADWQNNGSIDHVMIIDYSVNCQLGFAGVLLAQHSPSRRHKSLQEYVNDEPNAALYAYWICHNCL